MDRRLELHEELIDILCSFKKWLWGPFNSETDNIDDVIRRGAEDHVYFQPPENYKIEYPCIIYKWDTGDTQFADDMPYIFYRRYQITVIDANPDTPIPEKVAQLPMCTMDRTYTANNLNHYIFNIYY